VVFRYDSVTDQYVYVWKTEKAWAGDVSTACRQAGRRHASSGQLRSEVTGPVISGSGMDAPLPEVPGHLTGYKKYKPPLPGRPRQSRLDGGAQARNGVPEATKRGPHMCMAA